MHTSKIATKALVACVLLCLVAYSYQAVPANQVTYLNQFFDSLNGPQWLSNTGWKTNTDPCTTPVWFGLVCESGQVTQITLAEKNLNGTIPEGIEVMVTLQDLNVRANYIVGTIPAAVGFLPGSSTLGHNYFEGIPQAFVDNAGTIQFTCSCNNFLGGVASGKCTPPSASGTNSFNTGCTPRQCYIWNGYCRNTCPQYTEADKPTMPAHCTDINECATSNGGCDELVTCYNQNAAPRTCDACPQYYSGSGYLPGGACQDINECETNHGGCDALVNCNNHVGAAHDCDPCPQYYTGDGSVVDGCDDINECETDHGGCDFLAECSNNIGAAHTCGPCPSGYTGDGSIRDDCQDINECETANGGCDLLSECSNTIGSYSCGPCPSGYTGHGWTECEDINECETTNGGCDELTECTNTPGSHTCGPCPSGYTGNGWDGCDDINECETGNGGCDELANCINNPGSYVCAACPSGYTGSGWDDCEDINECETANAGCDILSECTNTPGSHTCGPCPSGYTGNGWDGCDDINECETNNGGCDDLTECTNTPGSHSCGACPSGYTGNGWDGCDDINECETDNGGCDDLAVCTNNPGSYSCGPCPSGYTGSGWDVCEDINECETNNAGCDILSDCTNTPGSHTCGPCPSGYTGNGWDGCDDINECETSNGGCDELAECTNTPGSYSCGACPSGYTGNGWDGCEDINECETNNAGCDILSECTNTPGSHSCGPCPSGYTGNGWDGCEDINECETMNGGCDDLSDCTNTAGSFYCGQCPSGYTGHGWNDCEDINECETGNGGCDELAECHNNPGSYTCGSCPSGYTGSGWDNCEDINECETDNGGCDELADCTNNPGSYTCGPCPSGYTGSGWDDCTDINECETMNGGCDELADCFNNVGSFTCGPCPSGYTGSGWDNCEDINECETANGGCDDLAECFNTPGSSSCGPCPSGYSGSGYEALGGCEDINECQVNNGGCSNHADCSNTVGSFTCSACKTGYTGANGNTNSPVDSCSDINECQTNNGGCSNHANCMNSPGSFSCGACFSGFTGTGASNSPVDTCTDINECAVNNGGCSNHADCMNNAGSFSCGPCESGYTGNGNSNNPESCTDINECATNNGGCSDHSTCSNTPGSYTCSPCDTGYTGDSYVTGGCVDINECENNNGGCDIYAGCVNTPGSYHCNPCPPKYQGNGNIPGGCDRCAPNYIDWPHCNPELQRIVVTDVDNVNEGQNNINKRAITADLVIYGANFIIPPNTTYEVLVFIGSFPCKPVNLVSDKEIRCTVSGVGANHIVEVRIGSRSNINPDLFLGGTAPRYDFSDPYSPGLSCIPPFGAMDTRDNARCNCWSGSAASGDLETDCSLHATCASVYSSQKSISVYPPTRPVTSFKNDRLYIYQSQHIVKNRRDTHIQFVVPAIPLRFPTTSPGTVGEDGCMYPGVLWHKKLNELDCIDEYYGELPWVQHEMCAFVEDLDPSNALNLVRVYKSNLVSSYTETFKENGKVMFRKVSNAFLVTVQFLRQIKAVTQYAVYIADEKSPVSLNVRIIGDALYDVASKDTIINFDTTIVWPYQLDNVQLIGTWTPLNPTANPVTAVAVLNTLAGGNVVCDTTQDSECEQNWVLTIDTQPGSDPQVCNLQGKVEFSTMPLLCRDYTTVGACQDAPMTNFTLRLGKTDLCDENAKVADASAGLTRSLETFYDREMSLPQTVFQTGDMVYFALLINNPAATIDSITFNKIVVSAADLSSPNTLYEVNNAGDLPTANTNTFMSTAHFNITAEVRNNMVEPGKTATLAFEFRLLRDVLATIADLSTIAAENMQQEVAVEVTIDIWYHGNSGGLMKRALTLSANAPLPASAHTQISFFNTGTDDEETETDAKAVDYSLNTSSASMTVFGQAVLLIVAIIAFLF